MFRFIIAFVVGKLAKFALKLCGKRATHFPGKLARKICPDFLKYIAKPKNIVCITGTDGKTSSSNMIEDCLRLDGVKFLDNNYGSNTLSGICATFIDGVNAFNKPKYDTYVLEIDERSSPHIYKYVTPTYIICTNLFRDSVMRNAHTEYIFSIIDTWIPKETKLILNGDDIISSRLGNGRNKDRVFFGIDRLEGEKEEVNIVNDGKNCPECGSPMIFDFKRYHHIGRAHCSNCDAKSPEIDYRVVATDVDKKTITMQFGGETHEFPMVNRAIFNIYNEAGVIAFLSEYGYSAGRIAELMSGIHIIGTRYGEVKAGNITVISNMLKGFNPIACSRVCHMAQELPGNKAVFIMVDDIHDEKDDCENISWYYEADLEAINDDSIKHIYISGSRSQDMRYRLLLAGIDDSMITTARTEAEITEKMEFAGLDTVLILYDMLRYDMLEQSIKPAIIAKINKEVK